MKKLYYLIIISVFELSVSVSAQSIVIGSGASLVVPSGADICAGTYGNISGNISGGGTQCGSNPLPVELTSFTANIIENKVLLKWITATEVNNYGFEIERAAPLNPPKGGKQESWEKIGFVEGHGNSNSQKQYSFTDENTTGGTVFKYRLKQIDTDGEYEYSDEVEVEIIPGEFVLYQNYPNPFNPGTIIKYAIDSKQYANLKVYDVLGNEVVTLVNEVKEAGIYEVEFNASNLPSGVYMYKLESGSYVQTKKMLLLK